MENIIKECGYVKNSIEPCKTCPKLMSCLHRCELLKETLNELTNQSDILNPEVAVCDCDEEHICGICYRSKGYDIVDNKLKKTV